MKFTKQVFFIQSGCLWDAASGGGGNRYQVFKMHLNLSRHGMERYRACTSRSALYIITMVGTEIVSFQFCSCAILFYVQKYFIVCQ